MCNRKNGGKGMDLTKIPTAKIAQLIVRLKTTRKKQTRGSARWWFWFRVQIKAHEEMGSRFKSYAQTMTERGIKNGTATREQEQTKTRKDIY